MATRSKELEEAKNRAETFAAQLARTHGLSPQAAQKLAIEASLLTMVNDDLRKEFRTLETELAKAQDAERAAYLEQYNALVKEYLDLVSNSEVDVQGMADDALREADKLADFGSNMSAEAAGYVAQINSQGPGELTPLLEKMTNQLQLSDPDRPGFFSPAAKDNHAVASAFLSKMGLDLATPGGVDDGLVQNLAGQTPHEMLDEMADIEANVDAWVDDNWDAIHTQLGVDDKQKEWFSDLLGRGAQQQAYVSAVRANANGLKVKAASGGGVSPEEKARLAQQYAAARFPGLEPLVDSALVDGLQGQLQALAVDIADEDEKVKKYVSGAMDLDKILYGEDGKPEKGGSIDAKGVDRRAAAAANGNVFLQSALKRQAARRYASESPLFKAYARQQGWDWQEGDVPTGSQFRRYLRAARSGRPDRGSGIYGTAKVDETSRYTLGGDIGDIFVTDGEGNYVEPKDVEKQVVEEQRDANKVPVVEFDLEQAEALGRVGTAIPVSDDPKSLFAQLRALDRAFREKGPEALKNARLLYDRNTGEMVLLDSKRHVLAKGSIDPSEQSRIESMAADNTLSDPVGDASEYRKGRGGNALQSLKGLEQGKEAEVAMYAPAGTQITTEKPIVEYEGELRQLRAGDPKMGMMDPSGTKTFNPKDVVDFTRKGEDEIREQFADDPKAARRILRRGSRLQRRLGRAGRKADTEAVHTGAKAGLVEQGQVLDGSGFGAGLEGPRLKGGGFMSDLQKDDPELAPRRKAAEAVKSTPRDLLRKGVDPMAAVKQQAAAAAKRKANRPVSLTVDPGFGESLRAEEPAASTSRDGGDEQSELSADFEKANARQRRALMEIAKKQGFTAVNTNAPWYPRE